MTHHRPLTALYERLADIQDELRRLDPTGDPHRAERLRQDEQRVRDEIYDRTGLKVAGRR